MATAKRGLPRGLAQALASALLTDGPENSLPLTLTRSRDSRIALRSRGARHRDTLPVPNAEHHGELRPRQRRLASACSTLVHALERATRCRAFFRLDKHQPVALAGDYRRNTP